MSIYCTYLTVYYGNLLPPFYIGSTSIKRINCGYRGSVRSKEYKLIWEEELRNNPDLFDTRVITQHDTRKDALSRETKFHTALDVKFNPLYINKSYAGGCFGTMGKASTETKEKMSKSSLGKPKSESHRLNLEAANRKKAKDPIYLKNLKASVQKTPEWKNNISIGLTGLKKSKEHCENLSKSHLGIPNMHKGKTYEEIVGKEAAIIRLDLMRNRRLEDPLYSCIYCKETFKGMGNLSRWHGDNCKMKSRII